MNRHGTSGQRAIVGLASACIAALGVSSAPAAHGADSRPNVIVIVADDLGWSDVGFHGEDVIQTPALDRLAREGAELHRFYTTPICSPTRAALMTGRDPIRLFPTLAAASGVEPKNERKLDGRNMWPAIAEGKKIGRDDYLHFASQTPIRGSFSLTAFNDEWKLVQQIQQGLLSADVTNYLFKISDDPNEYNNLAAAHPDVVAEMAEAIHHWRTLYPVSGTRAELLGIEHPILLPGMSWISKPELVAAVSEAGGLGILATGPLSEAETRAAIGEVRKRTDRPFGVGVTLMMPGAIPNARAALAERVPVVNFQLGRGEWLIEGAHAYGGKAITTVTSVKHAVSAERAGADAVLVTGHEAAAHGEDVTSLVLIQAVARAVRIPIVAAGGFADGRGLAAALALGASGVAMGTRFAATRESALHDAMKEVIVAKGAEETIYTRNFDGMWARLMRTPASLAATRRPMGFLETAVRATRAARAMGLPLRPVIARLFKEPDRVRLLSYFGAAIPKVEAATVHGDVEHGVQFIGQAQGLVEDVPAAGDVVRRVVEEAEAVLRELSHSG